MTKNVGFRIRLDETLRRDFVDKCKNYDRSAAHVIREFMRAYVQENMDTSQGYLFPKELIRERNIK